MSGVVVRRVVACFVVLAGLAVAFVLVAQQWYVPDSFLCGRPYDVALFGLRRSGGELVQPPSPQTGLCRATSWAWVGLAAGVLAACAATASALLGIRLTRRRTTRLSTR